VILRRLVFTALILAATVSSGAGKQNKSNAPAVTDLKIECLPASKATELIGQHGCVAGRVFRVTTAKSGNQHIGLCPPKSGCSFHAAVSRHDRDKVGDLSYLRGKYVAFDGDVTDFRGHPRIVVRDREQIHVTAGNPPSEFDSAQSRPKGSSGGRNGRAW
jgi:hypothetical protein